jgi:hypothetical protein
MVEVTDPAHPLYGRRFPVVSVSQNPQSSRHILVAYRGSLRLRIPIEATDRNLGNAARPRTRFTRDALLELLALLKENQASCTDHPGQSGAVSPMA